MTRDTPSGRDPRRANAARANLVAEDQTLRLRPYETIFSGPRRRRNKPAAGAHGPHGKRRGILLAAWTVRDCPTWKCPLPRRVRVPLRAHLAGRVVVYFVPGENQDIAQHRGFVDDLDDFRQIEKRPRASLYLRDGPGQTGTKCQQSIPANRRRSFPTIAPARLASGSTLSARVPAALAPSQFSLFSIAVPISMTSLTALVVRLARRSTAERISAPSCSQQPAGSARLTRQMIRRATLSPSASRNSAISPVLAGLSRAL